MRAALLCLLLCGCASSSVSPDGMTRYRYSSFDFSGDSWTAQQKLCAQRKLKPVHLGTDCGFWTCTSRYTCGN